MHPLQATCALIEISLYAMLVVASLALLRRARWAFARGEIAEPTPALPPDDAPFVTVQLPLRDELEMVPSLLECVAALDWPRDRLEVQVLDDSSDETSAEVDRVAAELRELGTKVEVVRRGDRRGYKAGALALGLQRARGELLLVLDADFRPESDLLAALHAVLAADATLAFCQARWAFRNERLNLLTRLQAAILDALFVVEQPMLGEASAPVQFNGTAGLWRKDAIARAGGWDTSDDALTEDLDLSFRAHELGLRGVTVESLSVSTELPPNMATFRAQQARWVRGGALTLRAIGRRLAARASTRDARVALGHLLRHVRQPLFVAAILRLALVATGCVSSVCPAWIGPSVFAFVALAATAYLGSARMRLRRSFTTSLGLTLVALSVGLAPILSAAFLGGLFGRRGGGFQRTPKGRAAGERRAPRPLGTIALAVLASATALLFLRADDGTGFVAALLAAVGLAWVAGFR
jgi:hypothetical protein